MGAQVHHSFFQAFLQRSGYVAVLACDLVVGHSLGYKLLLQIGAGSKVILTLLTRAIDTKYRNGERSIVAKLNDPAEKWAETFGAAIRREAHDLVFVRIEIKSEMEGDKGIENPDGVVG